MTYYADPVLAGETWAGTEIRLSADGDALLTNYPLGSLERTERGTVCLSWDGETLYTGPASWVLEDGRRMVVDVGDQESVVSAGSQLMGELNWAYDLGIAFCDGSDDLLLLTDDVIPENERVRG